MSAQPAGARSWASGMQTVEVIADHGFQPQTIAARAGVPLRIVFHRRDADTCMDRVVFSSPPIDRRIPMSRSTTIVLPPQGPGVIRFTCGMGRYHGQIQLQAEHPSPVAVLSAALARRFHSIRLFARGPAVPLGRSLAGVFAHGPEGQAGPRDAISGPRARLARGEISEE